MPRSSLLALCAVVLLALGAPSARAATPAEVEAAIHKGREFLYGLQKPEGRWEPDEKRKGNSHGDHPKMQGQSWGGFTACATYALLASGENPQDPRIQKAVHFLKSADITGTYALGMRCLVWQQLPQGAEVRVLSKRDAELLIADLNRAGIGKGGWDYDDPTGKGGRIDHSVSQYGVLGLWACTQAGYEVNPDVWDLVDKTWRGHQHSDGGWSYAGDGHGGGNPDGPTASMTAAGVATLFITQDVLRSNEGLGCKGNVSNENIEKGLKWMSDHFGDVGGNLYTWYGVERIGVASGYKYFDNKDWYAAGAEHIVRSQKKDGSWDSYYPGATKIPNTAFALLFLSRGRAPVIMNKLDYSAVAATDAPEGGGEPAKVLRRQVNWNQRPRDVANLARWSAVRMERDLNWQIVNLTASAEDLHDAPILFIAGSESIPLGDADVAKLRTFVEQGGMILANGDCGKEIFNKSFRSLGRKMFPKYEFRALPAGHPIFKEQQYDADKWKNRPKVEALSNGVRELMILVPDADPAKAWQARQDRAREELFQLGANVFLYAIDKSNLLYKGETFIVKDKGGKAEKSLRVARLKAGDNPDPEPGGWRRLAILMKNDHKLGLTVEPVSLGSGSLGGYKLAHLTGTAPIKLDAAARKELADFVAAGGTLVVDAAGGSAPFADSAEQELAAIFGAEATKAMARPLRSDHPVYAIPGFKLDRFGYRRFARKVVGDLKGPRLKGIKATSGAADADANGSTGGDRIGVFYSREDITGGLVGQPVDGILGYDVATATALMRNILLYTSVDGNIAALSRPAAQETTPTANKPQPGPFDPPDKKAPTEPKKPAAPTEPLPF
jgi:uncharacterized protein DUF4159